MRSFMQEFKAFIMRGNVIELAVAFVIGVAFTAVVSSFADDILMQIVAAIFGKQDFSSLFWTVNDSQIRIGAFITAVINFLIIAFGVFLVVKAIAAAQARRRSDPASDDVPPSDEVILLTQIRDLLNRPAGPPR
ncbi:MAG: large conductance mechanosensitive channel protein MscL [Acidimicrobiia bacterium]|nr:large conductance mechanosensitive channel protein MscL [Acidimicrobiia bacterium]